MENVALTLFVNLMMAALLLATIIYCWRLNNRIRILQDSRSELARIIREFDESTQRATQSIADIHEATHRLSENMQHKIDKANFLATDLDMMIEKGSRLTGRPVESSTAASSAGQSRPSVRSGTEQLVSRAPRTESPLTAAQGNVSNVTPLAQAEQPAARRGNRPRSRAEQELMSMLQSKNESGR